MLNLLLIFSPVLASMLWALYNEYKRHFIIGIFLLTVTCLLVCIRFSLIACMFTGMEMTPFMNFLLRGTSMYIFPFMYMYLCDQCGTRWYNHQAIFMLLLPLVCLIYAPALDFGETPIGAEHDALIPKAFNIFVDGKLVFHLMLRQSIIIVQCVTIAYCMYRLWRRVRSYGLKFTNRLKGYYAWMFGMIISNIIINIYQFDTAHDHEMRLGYFFFFTLILTPGFAFIPYSFVVAPIVTEAENKPVFLDNFSEQNQHLADHLHQLMEEDRIYLKPGLHIDDVAEMMGTNRTYVSRLMRQEFAQTFTDYINNARIIYSKKLLLTSSNSLEDIAMSSGYPNASAYCRVFKRITGTSPIAWKSEQK